MATLNQIRLAMRARPFRPFALRTSDDKIYVVKRPDSIVLFPTAQGREIACFSEKGNSADQVLQHVDIKLVLEVIVIGTSGPAPVQAPADEIMA
jgi:hypothetical protein